MSNGMGATSRIFRLLMAVVVLLPIFAKITSGTTAILLGIVALVFVLTSVMGI